MLHLVSPSPPEGVARALERGLELIATAVVVLDDAHRIGWANPAAENLFEWSAARLRGQTLDSVLGRAPGLDDLVGRAAATGAPCAEQELELDLPGRGRLHLACTASPVDAPGAALVLEFRRIDQQLKVAREARQLEQQEVNRELIRNLAHEIRNPLGGIRGAAQLLQVELDRPQLIEYTEVIIAEADRLRTLVDRLLSPHRAPAYRRINVHEVLVRVKGLVQAEFPAIPVICDFDTSLPDIDADPGQLMQAVLNIARNAAQALSAAAQPAPTVGLVTRVARGVTLARRHHRTALSIAIEDNGPGIAPELRDRVFFPLVSGRDGGSGLGLTIAQTYVSQHGGTIECESAPGRTAFRILLPLTAPRG
ncbi:MAG: PAS domain-containing protein [Proteobacteria bacterium]|nr:PAS domain-containing protein [Pseudomonadota bacterium]